MNAILGGVKKESRGDHLTSSIVVCSPVLAVYQACWSWVHHCIYLLSVSFEFAHCRLINFLGSILRRTLGLLERGLSSYRLLSAQETSRRLSGTARRHQFIFSVIFIDRRGGRETEGSGGDGAAVGREVLLIPSSRVSPPPSSLPPQAPLNS
jgi:hypothetical protein